MFNRVVRLYACSGFAGTDWRATLGTEWLTAAAQLPVPAVAARLRDVPRVGDVSGLRASARRHQLVSAHASALPIPPRGIPPV